MTVGRALILVGALLAAHGPAVGASEEPQKKAGETNEVSYYRQVRPIFQQHCQGCHQPARPKGGYVMTRHADLLKAGDKNIAGVIPGRPERSLLVTEITPRHGKRAAMPKGADPLVESEVRLIKQWIAQGAADDTPAAARQVVDAEHPPVYARLPVLTGLDYAPDGKLLAVPGYHEILLHHGDGSGLVARLVGLSDRIQSVAFSPDGKWLAATGGDPARFGEVQIWDVRRRRLRLSVPVTYDTIYGASWSPDGSKVAFGCADHTLRAIDSRTGKQVLFQGAHNDWVLGTAFSIDGSHLVSVSSDRSMKLVEVATQRFVDNITSITPGALKGGLMAVARHPRRDELLIGGADGVPKIYQMYRQKKRVIGDDFNLLRKFDGLPGRIFAVRYSPDGTRIAVASSLNGRGQVRIYRSGPDQPEDRLAALCALPGVAGRGPVPLLLLNDFRVGQLAAQCEGQQGAVYALAYRPDGKALASAGFDGIVRLNDPQTGKLLGQFSPVPLNTGGPVAKQVTRRK